MEIRISPSKIRRTPLAFNLSNATSSQSARTIDISGDNITTTSRKASMAIFSTSKEHQGAWGRGSISMSESIRSGVPVNKSRIESTSRVSIGQTNNMIALSSIFSDKTIGQMSLSPGDSLGTGSGILEATRTVSARGSGGGGRGVSTGRVASSSSRNKSATYISSTSNMIPDIGGTRTTSDGFTIGLAVNVEFSVSDERANEGSMRAGGSTDIKGFRSGINSGRATCRSTFATSGNESAADEATLGGNVVPDVGGAGKAGDGVTADLTVNIELGIGGDLGDNVGMGVGGSSDAERFGASVDLGGEANDGAEAEGDG